MGLLQILSVNLVLLLAIILMLWAYATRIHDASFVDAFWAFGMVILTWSSWFQSGMNGANAALIAGLVTVWGIRLSSHLFTRWRAHGEDPRYIKIIGRAMEKKGWSWSKTALIMVFLLQAPLLFATCLPAQIGIAASGDARIGWLGWIGAAIAVAGILFETIGDAQLKRFRADPDKKGQVLDTGLWRYTRHPNYFGDFATWWGIWIIAAQTGIDVALVSIIGPLFLSFTLMKWSGGPLLESGMKKSRPGYADYIARTSSFFPWPPKDSG